MNHSRSKIALKNAIYAILMQIFSIFISFISRTFFINYLGKKYLGLNGLFSNILSLLSFAELGIGISIVYFLYKPLYDKNEKKIAAYMNLYKKSYRIISIIVFSMGLLILPFLKYFIKNIESYNNINIHLIYFLFLLNSSLSYLNSSKRAIIIADQKKYIDSIVRAISLFLLNLFQIIILISTKNYYLFLILQIVFTILENFVMSVISNKKYKYLKIFSNEKLSKEEMSGVWKNVYAMTCHKIGGILVSSTDNLIISKFISTLVVGVYSNYELIISALKTLIENCFNAITATVGNIVVSGDSKKNSQTFELLHHINYLLISFSSIMLFQLANPFIELWIGKNYLLSIYTLILIVINFYLYGMRQTLFVFKNTLGLFKNDKYIPFVESVINIFFSILLVKPYGINGVFLGTIISNITTVFIAEPLIIYKRALNQALINYYKNYFILFIGTIISCLIISYFNSFYTIKINYLNFIIKAVVSLFFSLIHILFYANINKQFKMFVKNKMKRIIKKRGNLI